MLTEVARAKVNLCLHVTGRRGDGMHLLDSIVVFPELGDAITAAPSENLSLEIDGPFGRALGGENLILQAARLMGVTAKLRLTKNLPIASGIGGGSADAAASLRLLSKLTGTAIPPILELVSLGADVPVCVSQKPTRMEGVGDVLSPLPALPAFWILLVNAGQAVNTAEVFANLQSRENPGLNIPPAFSSFQDLVIFLSNQRNDMQQAAVSTCPEIGEVLSAITGTQECAFVRMSGSGGTCFGLYGTQAAADAAAMHIRSTHPNWWAKSAAV